MQTPDKYWEGIYWEGVTPESLHAVPLLGAESPDTSTRILIEQCTQRLKHERIRDPELNTSSAPLVEPDPEDYFITIQDAPLTSEDRRTVASWLESPHQRNLSWTTQAQSKVCCYLWHYRAFLGARVRYFAQLPIHSRTYIHPLLQALHTYFPSRTHHTHTNLLTSFMGIF